MSEIKLQVSCFLKLWNNYPDTRRCFFAVPNGGTRDLREAMQMKAAGLIAGEPDCILVWDGKAYGFEFKHGTGTLSDAQVIVHAAWARQKVPVFVIYTEEQFWERILPIIK